MTSYMSNRPRGYQVRNYEPSDVYTYAFRPRKQEPHFYQYHHNTNYLNRPWQFYQSNVDYTLTKENYYPFKHQQEVEHRRLNNPEENENLTINVNDVQVQDQKVNKWSSMTTIGETEEEPRAMTPVEPVAAVLLVPTAEPDNKQTPEPITEPENEPVPETETDERDAQDVQADWGDDPAEEPVQSNSPRPPPTLEPTQVAAVAAVSATTAAVVQQGNNDVETAPPPQSNAAPSGYTSRLPPEVLVNLAAYQLAHAN